MVGREAANPLSSATRAILFRGSTYEYALVMMQFDEMPHHTLQGRSQVVFMDVSVVQSPLCNRILTLSDTKTGACNYYHDQRHETKDNLWAPAPEPIGPLFQQLKMDPEAQAHLEPPLTCPGPLLTIDCSESWAMMCQGKLQDPRLKQVLASSVAFTFWQLNKACVLSLPTQTAKEPKDSAGIGACVCLCISKLVRTE